jgi:hypothetical protein
MSVRLKWKRLIARNDPAMTEVLHIGDRVSVFLDSNFWKSEGWFDGTLVRIDPYSEHRSFYWVELDTSVQSVQGGPTSLVSVLNPKNIRKLN